MSASRRGTVNQWALDGSFERYFHVGGDVSCARRCPTVSRCDQVRHRHSGVSCTTSTGRSSTFPHQHGLWSDGPPANENAVRRWRVTPDGQHISSARRTTPSRCGASQQGLLSTCAGTSQRSVGGGDARRPAHPQRRRLRSSPSAPSTAASSLALLGLQPSCEPDSPTRAPRRLCRVKRVRRRRRGHAGVLLVALLPDASASPAVGRHRQASSSTATRAPSDFTSRSPCTHLLHTRARTSLALLPDGLRSSAARTTTARIVEHGLAPAP